MTKRQKKRKAFLTSITAMILSIAMLVGTTFSWFTDSTSNTDNRVEAGLLDVRLLKYNEGTKVYDDISGGTGNIFNSDDLWEPGKTEVVLLQVKNNASLAFNYNIVLNVKNANEDAANTAKLEEVLSYAILPDVTAEAYNSASVTSWDDIQKFKGAEVGAVPVGKITAALNGALEKGESDYFALAIHMDEEAGNEYQGAALDIDVNVVAKQMSSENDSFGNKYDKDALWTEQTPEDPYKGYIDILKGTGDFEGSTNQDKWVKNGTNELDLTWMNDGDSPSGGTYMRLGAGHGTTYSRVGYSAAASTKIQKDTEYKLVAWIKWEGDCMPKIVFNHYKATQIGGEELTGNRRYYFTGLGEEGEWALAEITIPASDLNSFRLMIDTASWNSEKTPTDSSFNVAGEVGYVYVDGLKLLEPAGVDETIDLAAKWQDKLKAEAEVSQMVEEDTSNDNPYLWKDPLPGTQNLVKNGDFSGNTGMLRENGVNNESLIATSGWKPLITASTGENDIEITSDGTLKFTHNDPNTVRTSVGATAVIENIAGGAEYQVSFKYKINAKPADKASKLYGPFVSLYTYPDPSLPGAEGKLLEELHVYAYEAGTLVTDGEWHVFHGRTYVSEQAWLMEVNLRCYLYDINEVEIDEVQVYMVDVPGEIELEIDSKFYYADEKTAKFSTTLAGNLFPHLATGSSIDFVVYDGEKAIWSTEKIELDENYTAKVEFPLSNILKLDSPYVVKASLYDKGGELVCQVSDDIFVYERPTYMDKDGKYTKFADFNYSIGYHVYDNLYMEHIDKIKEVGVTVKSLTNANSAEHVLEQLDACWAEGIYGVVNLYRDMKPAGHPDNIQVTLDVITSEEVKNHPAMIGYNIMDEPWIHGTQSDVETWLEDSYRLIRQYDKDNIILTVENIPNRYNDTEKYVDVLEIDPYLPAAEAGVYNRVVNALNAVENSKTIWTILEAYKTNTGRILSADEARNNNYQALIAGADGIGYYSISDAGGSYTDVNGVKQYIPMWEMTSTADPDLGADLWAGLMEWAEKEQDLAFDHFVHGKTPDFNEVVAIDDGYIYSSWVVDGEVYLVVLNVAGREVAVNIPLTSTDGSVSIGAYTANVVAGSDSATITGDGSMSVTLATDKAILYKITPDAAVDFSGLE